MTLQRDRGVTAAMPQCLEGLASLSRSRGQLARAARLLGAAQVLRETRGAPLSPVEQVLVDAEVARVRAQLDEEAFVTAWAEGRALTLEQAIAYALAEGSQPIP